VLHRPSNNVAGTIDFYLLFDIVKNAEMLIWLVIAVIVTYWVLVVLMLLMSFLNKVLCTCSQIGSKRHPEMSIALTTFKQFNKCRGIWYCFFF